jgi:predicted phage terminase large subunit-like protein
MARKHTRAEPSEKLSPLSLRFSAGDPRASKASQIFSDFGFGENRALVAEVLEELHDDALHREELDSGNQAKDAADALRNKCSTLAGFVRAAWPILEPAKPLLWGWHIQAICDHLEAVTAGKIKYLLINIPPGTMKSLLVSVLWPAWEWGPAGLPGKRYLTTSYEIGLAVRDSTKMRRLIESKWYQDAWGDKVKLTPDQNAKGNFCNTAAGTRVARAINSTTGARGDRVIIDDPHSVVQAESDTERATTVQTFKESILSRTNTADSAIIVVMQRVHTQDVSGAILEHPDLPFVHLCLPLEFEASRRCQTKIGFVDPRTKEGEALLPELFPPDRIRELKVAGSYAWAGQYQQRPVPREGGLFKREWWRFVSAVPAQVEHRIRAWDLAATEQSKKSKDPDWTASCRMSRDAEGIFYIERARRFRGAPGAVERAIHSEASSDPRYTEVEIPQDPGGAGKAWALQIVKRLVGFTARATPVQGSKQQRATPASGQVEVGNIVIVRTGDPDQDAWIEPFLDELSQFPNGKHDDFVDAFTAAFNALALPAMKSQGAFEYARRVSDRNRGVPALPPEDLPIDGGEPRNDSPAPSSSHPIGSVEWVQTILKI